MNASWMFKSRGGSAHMQDSTPTRFPEANLQTHFTKQVELTENSRSLSPLPHRHQNDFLMVTCK